MALQAAEDRSVQRGEVFMQHLSRQTSVQWKNTKHAEGLEARAKTPNQH